jgi:SAM-dependent methyltransferase
MRRFQRIAHFVHDLRGADFLRGRRMLDVGCDTGDFVLAAQAAARVDPYGVDISTRAADIARNRGVIVSASDLGDAPHDFEDFALITAIDVIEHVGQPEDLLESIASRLAPDGVVYIETPNWGSAVYRTGERVASMARGHPKWLFERLFPPEHVQYFTVDGFQALLARIPLQAVLITTRPLSFRAVAGSLPVRAGAWLAQLPDRAPDRRILICVLLQRREGSL